jgi:hypothetical protein
MYFCVLCLIVVPLPPGKNPFAVQLNNNNSNNNYNNNNYNQLGQWSSTSFTRTPGAQEAILGDIRKHLTGFAKIEKNTS